MLSFSKFLPPLVCLLQIQSSSISAWKTNFMMSGLKADRIFTKSLMAGAQQGLEECKHQFEWDRWNCPEREPFSHNALRLGNRETSFVSAVSSCGVTYTLTRNCSMGEIENCGCDESKNGRSGVPGSDSAWTWGGCSDNIQFGEKVSRQILDSLKTGRHESTQLAAMDRHNNEAGRKAVRHTMKKACKCHGVSGACSTQTCWKQLAEFRDIGIYLKGKYEQAVRVEFFSGQLKQSNSASSSSVINGELQDVSKRDLVFLESSPDYCKENVSAGSVGTVGRECLRRTRDKKTNEKMSRWERQSCKRLCSNCGLKVKKEKVMIKSSCNCKFEWCCAVKCDECVEQVTKYRCQASSS